MAELATLTVTAAATDSDLPANGLSYQLEGAPAGATIDTEGVITWTPSEAEGPSTNLITVVATDDGSPVLSATNTFTVIVSEVNTAPVLAGIADQTVAELTTLTLTNAATDSDLPANGLSYHLEGAPAGATIDAQGIMTWTPTEAQGPSTNLIVVVATDDGSPAMSATNMFTVVVSETNTAPALASIPDQTVDELTALVVTNTATDTDIPLLALTYRLVNPPYGAQIDSNGVITWTPNEYDGPRSYLIETVVTDDGVPAFSATNSFTVTVNEVNTPPTLPSWTDGVLSSGQTFSFYNTASDLDRPANSLTYELIEAPAGAVIGDNGLITWTPAPGQVPSTNRFTMVATDYNPWDATAQHLSATNSFTITVFEPGVPPVIVSLTVNNGIAAISWSAVAGKSYRLQ